MNMYRTLRKIYTWKYFAVNIAAFVLYYLIARYLITYQEKVFL